MTAQHAAGWSRRQFLGGLTLAGTAGLLAVRAAPVGAERPPETPRLRLYKFPGICLAPQYVAELLLRVEGFTDLQYLEFPEGAKGVYDRMGSGAVDITQWYLAPFIVAADKKAPIVFLSGVHVGCQELVAIGQIRSIRDLRGKTVVAPVGGALNSVVSAMLGYVGLDYRKDVNFVEKTPAEGIQLLAEGKVDAYLATPLQTAHPCRRRLSPCSSLSSNTAPRIWRFKSADSMAFVEGSKPRPSRRKDREDAI